jgi:putative resolvase
MSKLNRSEAAKLKGVSVSTLRRWETEGKIVPERTENSHKNQKIVDELKEVAKKL